MNRETLALIPAGIPAFVVSPVPVSAAARKVPVAAATVSDRSGRGPACDLIFAGGRIVDGTGAPWFLADLCIHGDKIAAVGRLPEAKGVRRIDATGLVIAAGFIDMLGQSEYYLLVDNRAASKITQGITTEITGEEQSIAPVNARMIDEGKEVYERYGVKPGWTALDGYFAALERARPAINLGTFVGAGGVRNLVVGESERVGS